VTTVPGERHLGGSARAAWLVAGSVVVILGAGCTAQDSPGPGPERGVRPGVATELPVVDDCAGRIDHLIDSGVAPRADREYAIGMCEAQR
jgi:hypothetical protein